MMAIRVRMREFLQVVGEFASTRYGSSDYPLTRSDLIELYRARWANKLSFSEVIDTAFYHRLMDAKDKSGVRFDGLYLTHRGLNFIDDPSIIDQSKAENLSELQTKIDSTDWTGLAKKISPTHTEIIRSKANELLSVIVQSDVDIETRTNACKRVEAVIALLEAPNTPWREVVSLLSHPTVTASLAAVNLLQFLIGIAA